ncbi:MAG: hypothetical protein AB8G95_00935 [Anaerolineae bacterium]
MTRKIIFSLMFLLAFLMMGCEKQSHTVRYEIDGTAPTIGTNYKNGTNGNESADVSAGWSKEFTVESYYHLHLAVTTKNSSGSATCRIYVDGELAAEATATGQFKRAACNNLPVPATPVPQQ